MAAIESQAQASATQLRPRFISESGERTSSPLVAQVLRRRRERLSASSAQANSFLALSLDVVAIVVTGFASDALYGAVILDSLAYQGTAGSVGVVVAVLFASFVHKSGKTALGHRSSAWRDRAVTAMLSWCGAIAAYVAIAYLLDASAPSSAISLLFFFLLGLCVATGTRVAVPAVLEQFGWCRCLDGRDVILIGDAGNQNLLSLSALLYAEGSDRVSVLGFDSACDAKAWPIECRRLLRSVKAVTRTAGPGEILVCTDGIDEGRLHDIRRGLAIIPRALYLVPDDHTAEFLTHKALNVGDRLVFEVQKEPLNWMQRTVKRGIDVLGASLLVMILSPLLLTIAAAIKITSPGPVIFRQLRTGYRGRPFEILKFRTMTVQENGTVVVQACKNDIRVTPIGRILRKTSLDELPQLFNVLAGEMSLVGPRPHAIAHDKEFAARIDTYEVRQQVKPGITGWAQVSGLRGETRTAEEMKRRIEADLWYGRNISLWLDLRILLLTPLEVFRGRNAY